MMAKRVVRKQFRTGCVARALVVLCKQDVSDRATMAASFGKMPTTLRPADNSH
jgi:hypothetical protein